MKKVFVPFVFLIGLSFSQRAFSQSKSGSGGPAPMEVGSVLLNVGIGVGANYYGTYNYGTAFGLKAADDCGLWQAGPGVTSQGPEIGGRFSSGAYGGINAD